MCADNIGDVIVGVYSYSFAIAVIFPGLAMLALVSGSDSIVAD